MTAEVVIIGAGVVGCAVARFLTRRGVKPTIVEKDAIADHASGFAFGGLTTFHAAGPPSPEYPLYRASMAIIPSLADELKTETGIDPDFRFLPFFALTGDEAERARLTANISWLCAEGYPARWLDGEELRRLEPRFAPEVLGALRVEGAALIESYRYTLALAQSAEQAGAEIRHGEVAGLRVEGGRVRAVETRTGVIPCDQVVLAAGPWSGQASQWLGVSIPVRPLKGQIVRLRLPGTPLEGRFSWGSQYFAAKSDGTIWAGTTEEDVGFDERTTTEARDEILFPLAELLPALLEAEVVQQTACLRPLAADGLPIIGGVPGVEGLWVLTGGARRGIVLSAVMGEIGADLITRGHTAHDIAPFSLARFGDASAASGAPLS